MPTSRANPRSSWKRLTPLRSASSASETGAAGAASSRSRARRIAGATPAAGSVRFACRASSPATSITSASSRASGWDSPATIRACNWPTAAVSRPSRTAGCASSTPPRPSSAATPATSAGARYSIRQCRPVPASIGEPSCISPGLTMIASPASASTCPRPLHDRCAPLTITPTPNSSCAWRGNARSDSRLIASMPSPVRR